MVKSYVLLGLLTALAAPAAAAPFDAMGEAILWENPNNGAAPPSAGDAGNTGDWGNNQKQCNYRKCRNRHHNRPTAPAGGQESGCDDQTPPTTVVTTPGATGTLSVAPVASSQAPVPTSEGPAPPVVPTSEAPVSVPPQSEAPVPTSEAPVPTSEAPASVAPPAASSAAPAPSVPPAPSVAPAASSAAPSPSAAAPSPSAQAPDAPNPEAPKPNAPTFLATPPNLQITANPTPEDLAGTSEISKLMLAGYNDYRRQFGAGPVTWDTALAKKAYNQTTICFMDHEGDDNLFWEWNSDGKHDPLGMLHSWGGEWSDWPYDENHHGSHFTEMVWKDTKKIACSWSVTCPPGGDSKMKMLFLTCKHDPTGNAQGYYAANVGHLGDAPPA